MGARHYEAELLASIAMNAETQGYVVREVTKTGPRAERQPDMIIEKKGKKVAIEVKTSPITLTQIVAAKRLPVHGVIICASLEAFSSTAASVLDYAADVGIHISPPHLIQSALKEV